MLISENINKAYYEVLTNSLPNEGLILGIVDDSPIHKTGKNFPKQQIQHDHNTNTFFPGMRVLSSGIYRKGKFGAISSKIVGKNDNKLDIAKYDIDILISDFNVDVILFDSWYCKNPVLKKVLEHNVIYISRLRCDSKVVLYDDENLRLDNLAMNLKHDQYRKIEIQGKSYWICDLVLNFETYGTLRVIISKEGQHKKPIFLTTNSNNFLAEFVVKLYLKRFSIEVFFKDAKQFLNFETFLCRPENKWDLHLLLTNILHWCIQKKKFKLFKLKS